MITVDQIKELRSRTGVGVNSVREALEATNGNMDEAVKYLRNKGMAKSEKRKGKTAEQGILGTYIHSNKKVVVVVEVACETDFAAKSEDLVKFAQDLALHVAAKSPLYVNVQSVPEEILNNEKAIFEKDLEGKPENIKENILQGKLEKFYKDTVLIKQDLFTDESKTVLDYLNEMVAKIGEKIEITHFHKFSVGDPIVVSIAKTEE
jgi:elongation factor Ts